MPWRWELKVKPIKLPENVREQVVIGLIFVPDGRKNGASFLVAAIGVGIRRYVACQISDI